MKGLTRPEAIVMPEGASIPFPNVIVPPPNHFTHVLKRDVDYFYRGIDASARPDGTLRSGSKVALLRRENGGRCRVVDERGLYVEINGDELQST